MNKWYINHIYFYNCLIHINACLKSDTRDVFPKWNCYFGGSSGTFETSLLLYNFSSFRTVLYGNFYFTLKCTSSYFMCKKSAFDKCQLFSIRVHNVNFGTTTNMVWGNAYVKDMWNTVAITMFSSDAKRSVDVPQLDQIYMICGKIYN